MPRRRGGRAQFPISTRLDVLARCGWKCVRCGSLADLTFDHVHPYSKGGKGDRNNLQVLCRTCNELKGDSIEDSAKIPSLAHGSAAHVAGYGALVAR